MHTDTMVNNVFPSLRLGCAPLVLALLQACAAPQAPDFADNWKPVNTFQEVAVEIPLKEEGELHKFQMLPTDSTLRGLMQRWAKESGGELDWQYPSDLSLVATLQNVKDNNFQKALQAVRRSYAEKKLRIQVLSNKNVVVSRSP